MSPFLSVYVALSNCNHGITIHCVQLLLVVLLLTSLFDLFYSIDRGRRVGGVATFQYLSPVLLFTTAVSCVSSYRRTKNTRFGLSCMVSSQLMVGLVLVKDRQVGHRTSGLLLVFWILMMVYGTFKLRTYILTGLDKVRVRCTICLMFFIMLFF